jgi:glycerol-3-phosphate acyltransferase PlsY
LEGDGHISATALNRYIGWAAFGLAILMDGGKGFLALYIASLGADSTVILVIAAYAAVIGHAGLSKDDFK